MDGIGGVGVDIVDWLVVYADWLVRELINV